MYFRRLRNPEFRINTAFFLVKNKDSYDPYKAAYGSMPTHAASNQAIQQMYINGHFCYAYKFGIITNGLGIVRDITFYNKDFLKAHPDIDVGKKSDSPDEDKSLADSKALLPVLVDFFQKHPLITPKTFLGDAAFEAFDCLIFHPYSNFKCRSTLLISANRNLSVMHTHDFTYHRKSKSHAAKLTASGLIYPEKRFKDLFPE